MGTPAMGTPAMKEQQPQWKDGQDERCDQLMNVRET